MKRNWKWNFPHTALKRRTLCFSSYKNYKLKVKLRWVGARERKKRTFFVPFVLSEGKFFSRLCFSSMYVVLNTLSEYTYFTYQKNYFIDFCCLFLKSSKAFSVSLRLVLNLLILSQCSLSITTWKQKAEVFWCSQEV